MKKWTAIFAVLVLIAIIIAATNAGTTYAATSSKSLIFDEAGLLSKDESTELNELANKYGALRETDIIIFTTPNAANADVMKMTQDFYDKRAPGYDKPHGNAVILTVDMKHREVYLAGFYKAEEYLGDKRLEQIRAKISPDLSSGNYQSAFQKYIETSYRYMGIPPGVNPNNPLFNIWLQLGVSLLIGGIVVGIMAYRSGGRVTVDRRTYEDTGNSGVVDRRDSYIRTTVTKTKIAKSSGSGGGGGGRTGGGHSHSGSRGSF
ncbi:TPM domain-containing protein [Paenibacillus koleovorans]|uniref:TPM domain-containing protein n=1 Tax=Paenibacillus koleovorans TaxID=121608 RepID=UPI000FD9660D|nr:TPM domain-containing protein [Paenibacillus koleovorans]